MQVGCSVGCTEVGGLRHVPIVDGAQPFLLFAAEEP
jgi:hypothetical protein